MNNLLFPNDMLLTSRYSMLSTMHISLTITALLLPFVSATIRPQPVQCSDESGSTACDSKERLLKARVYFCEAALEIENREELESFKDDGYHFNHPEAEILGSGLLYGGMSWQITLRDKSLYTKEHCLQKTEEIISKCYGKKDGGMVTTEGSPGEIFQVFFC